MDAYYSGQETFEPTSEVGFNDEADSEEQEFSQDIELDIHSLTLIQDKRKRHSAVVQILASFTDQQTAQRVANFIDGLIQDFFYAVRTASYFVEHFIKMIVRICGAVAREISKIAAWALSSFLRMFIRVGGSAQVRFNQRLDKELTEAIGPGDEYDSGYYEEEEAYSSEFAPDSDEQYDSEGADFDYYEAVCEEEEEYDRF